MKTAFLVFLAFALPLACLAGAPDDTKPIDIANMKAIGAALNAFKKAKGEFPDHLSDLVPDYLDAKTLVSPRGVEADPRAVAREYDPKLPCTYCYEFGTNDFLGRGISFRALKTIQLQEYGSTLPLLRCFIYEKSLNLSHGGDFFETTQFSWEYDEETARLIKKNGFGPGVQTGKKLVVTVRDDAGHPIPGVALSAADRRCFGLPLPTRDFIGDEHGKVTIPLGVDQTPHVVFNCLGQNWFLPPRLWTFGDEGTLPTGDMAQISVILIPAAPIGGVIRDPEGHPLLEATVSIWPRHDPKGADGADRWLLQTTTDRQGAWTIKGIPKKNIAYDLEVISKFRTLRGQPGTHGVPDASALFSQTAEIRLAMPFSVKGTVRSSEQPVPGARVFLLIGAPGRQGEALTDATGQFEMTMKDEGKGAFVITADEFAPKDQAVDFAADSKPFVISLDKGRPLKGRLLQGAHIALPNASILFGGFPDREFADFLPSQTRIATTDAEGRFTWPHAPKDRVSCFALLPNGGDPWDFEWDGTKDDEITVTVGP